MIAEYARIQQAVANSTAAEPTLEQPAAQHDPSYGEIENAG